MAKNTIQATHENIHTGLSGLNNDEKWQDMLNFRSAQGRTSAVPHKFNLIPQECAGLHTIIGGLGGHCLAVGSKKSFGFVGADNVCPYPLWRVKQRYLGEHSQRDEQSQRLVLQGQYTGDKPIKLRVHYIAGKLTPYWDVKPAPVVEQEAPPTDYGCGGGDAQVLIRLTGSVRTVGGNQPIGGALVELLRFNIPVYSVTTTAAGTWVLDDVDSQVYTIRITSPGYVPLVENYHVTVTAVLPRTLAIVQPLIPLGINWAYTVDNPCNPTPWVITENNTRLRYNVVDSLNCGGTCDVIQAGTAEATIVVGSKDVYLTLDFEGMGEVQDAGFELISFKLDGVEVANAHAPGGNLGCGNGPVVKLITVPGPYLLNALETYVFLIEFTTNDHLYHTGAFYEIKLSIAEI